MHPAIQFTITKPTITTLKNEPAKLTNFLSLNVFATPSGKILTNIHYKETNTHEYLHYDSHHPVHVKNNIPFCLAKTIIVATSDETMMEKNLLDMTGWLKNCGYPDSIIERGIFNARLQGPANAPRSRKTIPFISTFFSNLDSSSVIDVAKNLIKNSKNPRIQLAFKDVDFIHARRQPPNILSQITSARFITEEKHIESGIFLCNRSNCNICEMYLQQCKSFETRKGTWKIKSHAHCNSKNVIYFQVCNYCNQVSNVGKTDDIRQRTNNHISGSRLGKTSNLFDQHNYRCPRDKGIQPKEPYFKLYIMMVCSNYAKLRAHERHLHIQGHDTINATNSSESSTTETN